MFVTRICKKDREYIINVLNQTFNKNFCYNTSNTATGCFLVKNQSFATVYYVMPYNKEITKLLIYTNTSEFNNIMSCILHSNLLCLEGISPVSCIITVGIIGFHDVII